MTYKCHNSLLITNSTGFAPSAFQKAKLVLILLTWLSLYAVTIVFSAQNHAVSFPLDTAILRVFLRFTYGQKSNKPCKPRFFLFTE